MRIHHNLILLPVFEESLQMEAVSHCAAGGYMTALGLTMQSVFVYGASSGPLFIES